MFLLTRSDVEKFVDIVLHLFLPSWFLIPSEDWSLIWFKKIFANMKHMLRKKYKISDFVHSLKTSWKIP